MNGTHPQGEICVQALLAGTEARNKPGLAFTLMPVCEIAKKNFVSPLRWQEASQGIPSAGEDPIWGSACAKYSHAWEDAVQRAPRYGLCVCLIGGDASVRVVRGFSAALRGSNGKTVTHHRTLCRDNESRRLLIATLNTSDLPKRSQDSPFESAPASCHSSTTSVTD